MRTRPGWLPIVLAVEVAVVLAVVAAGFAGSLDALALGDPGGLVRFGLPVVRVLHDLAAALAIGSLLLAAFLVPEGATTDRRGQAARLATGAAVTWAVASALLMVATFSDVTGMPPSDPGFWAALQATAWEFETTRLMILETALAGLLAICTSVARTRATLAASLALALLTLVPLSFTGHASGAQGHEQAMTGLLIHLVAVCLWVGGLIAIVMLRSGIGSALPVTVRRFSSVAGWCYAGVGISGVLFAWVQIPGWGELTSGYGLLVLAKIGVFAVLGVIGYFQRRRALAGDLAGRWDFVRFTLLEIAIMAAGMGLGVALGRTAPPQQPVLDHDDPALTLTQYPMPEPLEASSWLTAWEPFWMFLLLAAAAVGVYLGWFLRLRRRGDAWPISALICWTLGWAVFVYATSGPPAVYGRVMFSMHMVMHMTLMMAIPILLVLGSPITLALRALPPRRDRTWGPRELILALVHSRYSRFVANPVVAALIFFGSLVVFYYTDLLGWVMSNHVGHVLMVVHFTAAGYLFVWTLIGTDPGPPKWSPPMRLVVLFATLAAHAFFGLSLMSGGWLLAPEFYKALEVPWVPDLLADQQQGGQIAWGVGEIPTLFLALLVGRDWIKSDGREAKRKDRQADRDGDAELAAYNQRLQSIAARDRAPGADDER